MKTATVDERAGIVAQINDANARLVKARQKLAQCRDKSREAEQEATVEALETLVVELQELLKTGPLDERTAILAQIKEAENHLATARHKRAQYQDKSKS